MLMKLTAEVFEKQAYVLYVKICFNYSFLFATLRFKQEINRQVVKFRYTIKRLFDYIILKFIYFRSGLGQSDSINRLIFLTVIQLISDYFSKYLINASGQI
jgi:hypothetical protein